VLVAVSAGCGAGHPAAPVAARIGQLQILNPFLPDPASPAVASVYLTVRNTGASADRLVAVTSPLAHTTMLMTEEGDGATGTMAPLAGLAIPAHGTATLQPGHDHLMLENPAAVRVGQLVEVTLRFARSGTVAVEVPVVPLSAIVGDNSDNTNMKGMKGMRMGSTGS
jgi:copper(I)-binding protein